MGQFSLCILPHFFKLNFSVHLSVYQLVFSLLTYFDIIIIYRTYSRNSRTFLTKILYLNLGCVIYARKRFYVNKSGNTGNFLNIVLKA